MKLYEVTVTHKAYVLADKETDAIGYADEILRTEDQDDVEVVEVEPHHTIMARWNDSFVYHPGKESIRVDDVWPESEIAVGMFYKDGHDRFEITAIKHGLYTVESPFIETRTLPLAQLKRQFRGEWETP